MNPERGTRLSRLCADKRKGGGRIGGEKDERNMNKTRRHRNGYESEKETEPGMKRGKAQQQQSENKKRGRDAYHFTPPRIFAKKHIFNRPEQFWVMDDKVRGRRFVL